jgi:hypothetical protein
MIAMNAGVLAGYALITIGLVVLLVGLLWSAVRRLRNLSDDPRSTRVLIVAGLVLAAMGVILGAVAVRSS